MKKIFVYLLIPVLGLGTTVFTNAQNMQEPKAQKKPTNLEKFDDKRIDNYYWLNDRENPEVIEYLKAENQYADAQLKDTEELQEKLFEEMKSRIKEDDSSVPYKQNGYWYSTRYEKGDEYPIHIRQKESLDAPEEILFDVNEMAAPYSYYNLRGIQVSDDNKKATFGTDTVSRRIYTIRVKDLETGKIMSDVIENTDGNVAWAADNQTFFYIKKDDDLREFQIWKHRLGTPQSEDELVFEEADKTFYTRVYRSKSREYIIISSSSTVSDEYRFLPANQPDGEWTVLQPRERDLEYDIEHYGDHFYILTNKDGATNFKLMKTPVSRTAKENWTDVIPYRKNVQLEGIEIFRDFLVLQERENAQTKIIIRSWDGSENFELPIKEEVYSAFIGRNPDFDSNLLRYNYTSLTTPNSVIDFNMKDKTSEVKKEQEVLGGFNKEDYETKRIWVTARDGVKIPVSLVYRKDTQIAAGTPLLQYGYGSYGFSMNPYFSPARLSLLDRGFIYALAHIRGGEEMGRPWYEDGKMLTKKNTFNDFVDVSRYLIDNGYTSPEHLYIMGGSAGGLLMGAVMNQAPELYKGVVAQVPFVDVLTTMLDDTIPLTTGEYDEWGNPNVREYYDYMKSYSPYDNIEKKTYPNLLVTTGLHDSQVQYWEPAKWVAKLRELKTGDEIILLKTDMEAGHGGASGRFQSLKDVALEYAFILKLENIKD